MADQNLPMSDEIATLVGHFVRPIFVATFDLLCPTKFSFCPTKMVPLSDMGPFKVKKNICSPAGTHSITPLGNYAFVRSQKEVNCLAQK